MNTSQYPADIRKQIKRLSRSPDYQRLQQANRAERERLEIALRERNLTIERLKKKLVEAGVPAAEVAKLAA